MKTITREVAISELLSSRIDSLMIDPFYMESILLDGFKGFNEFTNKELKKEYDIEFDYEEETQIL